VAAGPFGHYGGLRVFSVGNIGNYRCKISPGSGDGAELPMEKILFFLSAKDVFWHIPTFSKNLTATEHPKELQPI